MAKLTIHTEWDLTPLLEDEKAAEGQFRELRRAAEDFAGKWSQRKDWLADAEVLRQALDEYEKWQRNLGPSGGVGHYYALKHALKQNDPDTKAGMQKARDVSTELWNQVQFFELRLGGIGARQQEKFLKSKVLEPYRHFLERLFESARHRLSEAEERIINLKADTSYSKWVDMLSGFLAAETREVAGRRRSFEEIMGLLNDDNKSTRDAAAEALNDILSHQSDAAEAEINAVLAYKKTEDELRGFARPDSSRHIGDDIATEAVDTLLGAVDSRNDLAKRYYRLKADLLGVGKLAYHERNLEYGDIAKEYPFEAAAELVHDTCSRLDPEFASILEGYLQRGQIDVFPAQGKRGGAFCHYGLIEQPTYILLNHTEKLRDVVTLAHELGHGINAEYMRKERHALDFDTPMATAEVASQFLEDFVLEDILAESGDELRLAVMMSRLNDTVSSVFRQVACYRFEQDIHSSFRQQGYLSRQEIGSLFSRRMGDYMGDAVEQSPGSQNWWIYWSHIRTFFYVYSYASGLLIAKAMQARYREDPAFMFEVKQFLAAGTSASPVVLFNTMGFDITKPEFWQKGLAAIEEDLQGAEELARKLGKLR